MKYFEAFAGSGIGSKAMYEVFGEKATCIGFSEVNKYATNVYQTHFKHQALGSITELDFSSSTFAGLTLVIAGPPCQNLTSMTKNREGLFGDKSILFLNLLNLLKLQKPKYILIENVASMSTKDRDLITAYLQDIYGTVYLTKIDAGLVSAQRRVRYYWTNFPVRQPEDKGILLPGVIAYSKSGRNPEDTKDGKPKSTWTQSDTGTWYQERYRNDGKANTLLRGLGCNANMTRNYILVPSERRTMGAEKRLLTPEECEFLQSWPTGWTEGVPTAQRYKILGNGFNRAVINHILNELKVHESN